jgi:predicted HD phosphohydrolase
MGVMEEEWGLEPLPAVKSGDVVAGPSKTTMDRVMRHFPGGATRNTDEGKYDFEGYLSPAVLYEFGRYMYEHGHTPEGQRASDNWQKGFGEDVIMKSLLRHVMDLWILHRTGQVFTRPDGEEVDWFDALGGALFNVMALWHESLEEV